MTNHQNRRVQTLVIYTRSESGILSRHTIRGMTEAEHAEHYDVGPVSGTEALAGWPESSVEWHGNVGYAR